MKKELILILLASLIGNFSLQSQAIYNCLQQKKALIANPVCPNPQISELNTLFYKFIYIF